MAINYVLYLADDRKPHEVAEEIARELKHSGAVVDTTTSAVPAALLPHLWVGVTAVKYPTNEFVREEHGLEPRVRVHLRLDKEQLDKSQNEVLEVVGLLLRRSFEDAVLLREEENVALVRREGKLELGADALWEGGNRDAWIERHRRRRGTTIA